MEASRPADGERSGLQEEQQRPASAEPGPLRPPQQQQQKPPNPRRGGLGRMPLHRQPKRSDLLLRLQQQQAVAWRQHSDAAGPSRGGSFLSPQPSSASPLAPGTSSQQGVQPQPQPSQEGGCPPEVGGQTTSSRRGDKKPPKPGKYVCTYCGRPCAKPSVLQKHIRSHTGERPYPCVPCGFSFKTKSNLYKHRKSHAHRIKAGLAPSGEAGLSGTEGPGEAPGEEPEEAPTEGESTDSEEETGEHHRHKDRPPAPGGGPEEAPRPEDSQAVKQRLAMRLSERKRGPLRASPDTTPSSSLSTSSSSSLGPGSKGSTESGYFSGSGCSTELSQVSPPSASVKTYAEIILGKYGRLGAQQQRGAHHQPPPHHQHLNPPSASSSGEGEKPGMSFSVPNTQVIEHITKLITINEAVVDTSEIDSVKPRRSSLSRKSSSESAKLGAPKDPYATSYDPKGEAAAPSAQDPSAVPLFRSHSVPSDPSTACAPSPRGGGRHRRLSHSFDEQQAVMAEMRVGHAQRLLKRQPAIEVPLGAELLLEGAGTSPSPSPSPSSSSARGAEPARTPPHHPHHPQHPQQHHHHQQFECAACGAPCLQKESYEAHRASCPGQQPKAEPERGDAGGRWGEDRPPETTAGGKQREDRPQMMHYKFRALAMAVRKRRKEESLEEDPPSPGPVPPSPGTSSAPPQPGRSTATPPPEHSHAPSGVPFQAEAQHQHQDRKGVSVIQHTSSFEKQDSVMMSTEGQPPHHQDPPESPTAAQQQQQVPPPQPKASAAPPTSSPRLLQRQRNIQVPEILVTVEPDTDMPSVSPPATVASAKEPEKVEEFQWPQRSQSMAQLPTEKLPPKKKRLRLAEVSQSSGESLPRSPSQESNVSYTSSSLLESNVSYTSSSILEGSVADEAGRSGPGGQQQGSQMLTVPSSSSSSHQSQQQQREMRRSASEQSPASPGQADQSAEASRSKSFDLGSLSPQHPAAAAWKERRKCLLVKHATLGKPEQEEGRAESPKAGPSTRYSPPEAAGKSLQLFHKGSALALQPRPWEAGFTHLPAAAASTVISEVLSGSAHIVHRYRPVQVHPAQVHMAERLGIPLHQLPSSLLPLHFPPGSRAACLPGPSRLTIQVPREARLCTSSSTSPPSPAHRHHHQSLVPRSSSSFQPRPVIITCLAQLTPVVSLVVPVRLQTHMPPYASAMNTTLSQMLASSARLQQDPICCTTMVIMGHLERRDKMMHGSYLKIPAVPDLQGYLPLPLALQPAPLASGSASDEAVGGYCGPLGAGGSKRMLSPAASLELSTEAQRLKKRVKEEEEEEEEEVEEGEVEQKREGQQKEEEAREEKESKATGSKLEEEEEEEEVKDVAGVKVEEEQKKEEQNVPKTSQEEEQEEEATKEAKPKREEEEEEVTVEQREGVAPGGRVSTPRRSAPQSPERPSVAAAASSSAAIPAPPPYPSLDTATSVNWCYLNYVKPNPWAQGDPRTSVYSTWSVSVHNPNLPGLSTKVALSLLCSKQRHSAQTYTMATGPLGGATTDRSYKLSAASGTMATGPLGGPDGSHKASAAGSSGSGSTPHCVTEVHAAPPGAPLQVKEPLPPPHQEDKKKGKREEEEEDGASTSKQGEQPPRVRIFEGGYRSSEEYVYVRGRGRGRYVCGECGIRCKKPSMLRKHIRTHTDVRPYVCRHCNFAFKTKGNLTKHMKSKTHGKKCQAMGVSESSLDEPESEEASGGSEERVHGSEEQQEEEHQFSDVDESDEEEENEEEEEDEEEEESSSHDEPPSSSCSSHDTRPSTGGRSRQSQQGTPDPETSLSLSPSQEKASPRRPWPEPPAGLSPSRSQEKLSPRRPWPEPPAGLSPSRSQEKASPRRRPWPGGRKATSPGSRRAVYSRRGGGWNAGPRPRAFSSPSSESCSPSRSLSPRLDLSFSPVRSLSPRLDLSFSPVRSLSPRLDLSFSPVRSLSPRTDLSSPVARHLSPSPERGPSPVRAASASPLRCGFRSARRSQVSPSPLRLQHYRPPAHLPWESPGSKRAWERGGTAAGEVPMSPEATSFPPAAFRPSPGDAHPGHQGAVDHVFSHLPMHSQQAKVPYLMIPIGGIQMVQAGPRSHPTTHQHHPSSPTSPPTEGPSLARFEWSSWGWTPRTQGLRTPGRPWSEGQGAGGGRAAPASSRPQPETTDSKQYGSLYSFTHTHHHHLLHRTTPRCVVAAAESAERSRDSHLRPPLNRTAPSSSSSSLSLHAIGRPPEWEEPRSVAEPVEEGGAKGETDRSDQSTSRA